MTFGTAFGGGRGHFLLSGDMAHTEGFVSLKNGENHGKRAWAFLGVANVVVFGILGALRLFR